MQEVLIGVVEDVPDVVVFVDHTPWLKIEATSVAVIVETEVNTICVKMYLDHADV